MLLLLVLAVLLTAVLTLTGWTARRALKFTPADDITLRFCGSTKSLASGLPIASVVFAGPLLGLIVLPLMLFHQMQLIVCAVLARRYGARQAREQAAQHRLAEAVGAHHV